MNEWVISYQRASSRGRDTFHIVHICSWQCLNIVGRRARNVDGQTDGRSNVMSLLMLLLLLLSLVRVAYVIGAGVRILSFPLNDAQHRCLNRTRTGTSICFSFTLSLYLSRSFIFCLLVSLVDLRAFGVYHQIRNIISWQNIYAYSVCFFSRQ